MFFCLMALTSNADQVDFGLLLQEEDATVGNLRVGMRVRRGRDWPASSVEDKFKVGVP